MDTVHEDDYTFSIIPPSVLLRMRNISDKFVEKIRTHFISSFFVRIRCLFRVTWRNIVLSDRTQMTMRCMRFACWINKTTDKLRMYNTYCFLLQQ
jgi:hypothetical protein